MKLKILGIILSTIFLIASCNESDMDGMKETASVSFKLVDDPIPYDAVLIDVIGLEYKLESDDDMDDDIDEENENEEEDDDSGRLLSEGDDDEDDSEGEWHIVDIEPMVYNILELQNGAEALLADTEIEAGELKEIRLILGSNNDVVIGEDTMALKVPSGSQSGLKVKVDTEIEPGEFYDVVIDFVASKSIVKTGNGKYILKPVVHVALVADDDPYGSISGIVTPAENLNPMVHAINIEEDTVSTQPEEDGSYLIDLLLPGTYTVVVETNEESGFENFTISDVQVMEEETTDLETVTFE